MWQKVGTTLFFFDPVFFALLFLFDPQLFFFCPLFFLFNPLLFGFTLAFGLLAGFSDCGKLTFSLGVGIGLLGTASPEVVSVECPAETGCEHSRKIAEAYRGGE